MYDRKTFPWGNKFIILVHLFIIATLFFALPFFDNVYGQPTEVKVAQSDPPVLENDAKVNIYRLNQIEREVKDLKDGQKTSSTLLIASLVGVVVNFATYIIMNRKKSGK